MQPFGEEYSIAQDDAVTILNKLLLKNLPKWLQITLPTLSFTWTWTHCRTKWRARGNLTYHRYIQHSKPFRHRKHAQWPTQPNPLKRPLSTIESMSTPAQEQEDSNTHPDAEPLAIDFKKPKQPRRKWKKQKPNTSKEFKNDDSSKYSVACPTLATKDQPQNIKESIYRKHTMKNNTASISSILFFF